MTVRGNRQIFLWFITGKNFAPELIKNNSLVGAKLSL